MQEFKNFLNFAIIVNTVTIFICLSFWLTIQIRAENFTDLIDIPVTTSQPQQNPSPQDLNYSFRDTSCSHAPKPVLDPTPPNPVIFAKGGISKHTGQLDIQFKGSVNNHYFYGQTLLNSDLIGFILCVMEQTKSVSQTKLQLNDQNSLDRFLDSPKRILILDEASTYHDLVTQTYGDTLGDSPLALFETDTISTYLKKDPSQNIQTRNDFKDIRLRLTQNIAHEYFHLFFHFFSEEFVPFIEEGMASYIAGDITQKVLGYDMGCAYRYLQAKSAKQNQLDLSRFDITTDPETWHKSNQQSILYSIGYYFIRDLDENRALTGFTRQFLHNPDFQTGSLVWLNQRFLQNLPKQIELDTFDCSYFFNYAKPSQSQQSQVPKPKK